MLKTEPQAKKQSVLNAFEKLWSDLFSSPVHLDSALAHQAKNVKSILAQIAPFILLRPVSQAEALGVGMSPGEPWDLSPQNLASWRSARLMAERLYSSMAQGWGKEEAVEEDFPPRMIREWKASFGEKTASQLMKTLGKEPPLSLRAARKLGAQGLSDAFGSKNPLPVSKTISDFAPLGVRLAAYAPVMGTELYQSGGFEIQDEGSQIMALFALWPERIGSLLGKSPGPVNAKNFHFEFPEDTGAPTIIDACAGAGGKSLAIADALQGKGRIFSYDTSSKKLEALRRRASRAGLRNIQAVAVKEGEESQVIQKFKRRANAVLVDAPCSGWGVLRRNPDLKWRQSVEVLEKMPRIQIRLLSQYSDLVAPGGRLTYGVCTFRSAETEEIVKQFLETHPDFEAREGGYLGPGPCDGFFMQSFQRR